MTKIIPTPQEKHAISVLLDRYCRTNDGGQAYYIEGYDDQKIAEEAGRGVIIGAVQYKRRQLFGNLFVPPHVDPDYNSLLLRVIAIENHLGLNANASDTPDR